MSLEQELHRARELAKRDPAARDAYRRALARAGKLKPGKTVEECLADFQRKLEQLRRAIGSTGVSVVTFAASMHNAFRAAFVRASEFQEAMHRVALLSRAQPWTPDRDRPRTGGRARPWEDRRGTNHPARVRRQR